MSAPRENPPAGTNIPRFLLAIVLAAMPGAIAIVFFGLEDSLPLALMMLPSMLLAIWLVDPEDFGLEGPRFLNRR